MPHQAAKRLAASCTPGRRLQQCLTVSFLVIAFAITASAQIHVSGNSGSHWVDTGIDVVNGTQIQVLATGRINVGARGAFGPEGTTAFRSDAGFPADGPVYGLVIRLTTSRTDPGDEFREDYFYASTRTICFHAIGHLWLTANDDRPGDNSGEFLVTLTRGACAPVDPARLLTRIRVANQSNIAQRDADVYVNGLLVGRTGSDGMVGVRPLNVGDHIIARKLFEESSTYRNNHRRGSTQNWNYRVYLTTVTVNNDGTVADFIVAEPLATQELRLNRNNTLIGLHLLASIEWDASSAELEAFRSELVRISQFLYNATDGQFFVEQIDLADDAAFWNDTDYRIYANLDVRPNVNLRVGGFLRGGGGTWMNMRRAPAGTDFWSTFDVFAHEFGHYGFDVRDEYADDDGTVFCAANYNTEGSDYQSGQPKASCMMFYQADAGKLCSNRAENPHRRGTRQGAQSCWSHLATQYVDTLGFPRWNIQTPDTRGAIVGGLPDLPAEWAPRVNVDNRPRGLLCGPISVRVSDSDSGAPINDEEVWLLTSYGQIILQGRSGGYDSGSARVSFGGGMIPVTGVHVGDRIAINPRYRFGSLGFGWSSEYTVRASDCGRTSRLQLLRPDDPVSFVSVSTRIDDIDSLFMPQRGALQLTAAREPFRMFVSLEPVAGGQVTINVRTDAALRSAPEAEITLKGSTNALRAVMKFDAASQSYTSNALKISDGAYASLQVTATAEGGSIIVRLFSLVLSPLNANAETDVFSADGQLNLTVPAGALPQTAVVAIGPSSAPLPPLGDGDMIVSGPFSVTTSSGNVMRRAGVVRFQLSNLRGARASDGFDPRSFEIRRFSPESKKWESLGGRLLTSVDVISVSTNQLGDYAVTAHTLAGNGGGKKPEARKPEQTRKPEQFKKPGEREKAAANFMVSDAGLKPDEPVLNGPCPVTVKFGGFITANGPGRVQYTFTRSDGATGPTLTLDFKAAGTQYVTSTWTLGGQGLNSFKGWQAIKILTPNEFESSRQTGSFGMKCQGKTW